MSHSKKWACERCQLEVDEYDRLGNGKNTRNALCSARAQIEEIESLKNKLVIAKDALLKIVRPGRMDNADSNIAHNALKQIDTPQTDRPCRAHSTCPRPGTHRCGDKWSCDDHFIECCEVEK